MFSQASNIHFSRKFLPKELGHRVAFDDDPQEYQNDFFIEDDQLPVYALANKIALALDRDQPLSSSAAAATAFSSLMPGVKGCSLTFMVGAGDLLMERHIFGGFLQPHTAKAATLPRCCPRFHHSAAGKAILTKSSLLWKKDGKPPQFSDWKRCFDTNEGVESIVTVPLTAAGCRHPTGAVTFSLDGLTVPVGDVVNRLEQFSVLLSRAIGHNIKFVSEASLDFLRQVIPPAVLRCMTRGIVMKKEQQLMFCKT